MTGVLRPLLGLAFFVALAWLLSSQKKRFPVRVVVFGLVMQVVLAWLVLRTSVGQAVFQGLADKVAKLITMAVRISAWGNCPVPPNMRPMPVRKTAIDPLTAASMIASSSGAMKMTG